MFEDFIITDHIMQRYQERVSQSRKDVIKKIKKDLHFTKVKRIVNVGNIRHVFTRHSKEFIFVNDRGQWVLRTIIKRSRNTNDRAIYKRSKQKEKLQVS